MATKLTLEKWQFWTLFWQNFHKTIECEDVGSKISEKVPECLTYLLDFHLSQKYDKKYTMCSFYPFIDSRDDSVCIFWLICIKYILRMYLG